MKQYLTTIFLLLFAWPVQAQRSVTANSSTGVIVWPPNFAVANGVVSTNSDNIFTGTQTWSGANLTHTMQGKLVLGNVTMSSGPVLTLIYNTASIGATDILHLNDNGTERFSVSNLGEVFVHEGGRVDVGSAGVRITTDNDGAIRFLGLGNGSDEDFDMNLDDTANTVVFSSNTGVTTASFPSMGLTAASFGGINLAGSGSTLSIYPSAVISFATHNVSFTTTGITSITLPTSGTLATLAGVESLTNKRLGDLTTNGFVTVSGGNGSLGSFAATSAALASFISDETGTAGALVLSTGPTISNPVITNIAPGANFTLTQNSVAALTSVNASAVEHTLYLNAGKVGILSSSPQKPLDIRATTAQSGLRIAPGDTENTFGGLYLLCSGTNAGWLSAGVGYDSGGWIMRGVSTAMIWGCNGADAEFYGATGTSGAAATLTRVFRVTNAGAVSFKAGISASDVQAGGALTTDTTTTGNVGAGEDTLQTYSVPAASLSTNGHTLRFTFAGTIANNANAKRLRLKYGATTIFDTGAAGIAASNAMDWSITGEIIRTGATTQKCIVRSDFGVALVSVAPVDYTTAAETLSGAVNLVLTGEGVSNNDIVKEILKLHWEP